MTYPAGGPDPTQHSGYGDAQPYPHPYPPGATTPPPVGAASPYASPYGPPAGAANPYGQHPFGGPGYPYPGYPAPIAARGPQRPGPVTAAAVLAFVWSGFSGLFALFNVLLGGITQTATAHCDWYSPNSEICAEARSVGTFVAALGIGLLIVCGLLIWGGVAALSGSSPVVIVVAAVGALLAHVGWLAISWQYTSASTTAPWTITIFAGPVLILALILQGSSRAWFGAKRSARTT